jgi:hypothetical protein
MRLLSVFLINLVFHVLTFFFPKCDFSVQIIDFLFELFVLFRQFENEVGIVGAFPWLGSDGLTLNDGLFNDGDILPQTVDQLGNDAHKVFLRLLPHVEDDVDVCLSVSAFDGNSEKQLPNLHHYARGG